MLISCKYFKIYYVTILLCLYTIQTNAQDQWMLGLAPSLELEEDLLGVNARIYYGVDEHFCFGPEVTFFPNQGIENGFDLKIVELNLNAHYIFELSHNLGIYPLSGVNYSIEQRESNITIEEEKEDAFGLNYGLGLHYNIGKTFVFAEFKGVVGKLNDEFISIGMIFSISKHKE